MACGRCRARGRQRGRRAASSWAVPGELELAFEPAGGARGHLGATAIDGDAAVLEIDDDGGRALTRAVAIFLGPVTLALSATRPPGARGHGEERLSAVLVEGDPPAEVAIADPRLSTTYDGEGRVMHCGLELWEGEESEFPRRAAGEASAHGELTHAGGADDARGVPRLPRRRRTPRARGLRDHDARQLTVPSRSQR